MFAEYHFEWKSSKACRTSIPSLSGLSFSVSIFPEIETQIKNELKVKAMKTCSEFVVVVFGVGQSLFKLGETPPVVVNISLVL